MILSDLNLNQPLPIQLSQVTNYVVINDPAFPPLSTIVVNGYDAFGNPLSSIQVFPRTAKIVRTSSEVTLNETIPNPLQLSQVTNYIPLYNDDATFPALSTTVVEGYNAYGSPIVHTQIFPRTVRLVNEVATPLNISVPSPVQLSQVTNYVQVSSGIDPLSCIVVNGYNAYGNAISAVQIFPRNVQLVKEVSSLNWDQTAANPIQLEQVTNYVQLYSDDSNFPALSTIVVNGYDAFGNPNSAVQVFPRTASLIYKISPSTVLDYSAPLPIQLSQVGNFVPLYNNDTNYPALSTVVVNGYDAFGNPISSVQVFPRMVSLVFEYSGALSPGYGYLNFASENLGVFPGNYLYKGGDYFNVGTGDFTIEFYFKLTNPNACTFLYFTDNLDYSVSNKFWILFLGESIQYALAGSPTSFNLAPTLNEWHHFALSRASGTFYPYLDGQQGAVLSETTNFVQMLSCFIGGLNFFGTFGINEVYCLNGSMSNVRVTENVALYTTSSFTPPTPPLSYDANTTILLMPVSEETKYVNSVDSETFINHDNPVTNQAVTFSAGPIDYPPN
jgi:hypothetical protein